MARPTRFSIAKKDILEFFESQDKRVFMRRDLSDIFYANWEDWRLAKSMTIEKFAEELVSKTTFKKAKIDFGTNSYVRFVYGDVSIHQIALGLKSKTYLSHYTAVSLHRLTNQQPKIIYVSHELSAKIRDEERRFLVQDNINKAFVKPQRKSENIALYKGVNICLLSAKHSNQKGVIQIDQEDGSKIRMTGLERTLIDIVVRPGYSGGIEEVLKAYKTAKDRVSVNKLNAILKTLDYIYPYQQSIGFYMERAGYSESQLELMCQATQVNDFYLTYEMKNPEYSKKWRLYYPKGF